MPLFLLTGFSPPKLACLIRNIPCPPTRKVEDSLIQAISWNFREGLRMVPNLHVFCLYLLSSSLAHNGKLHGALGLFTNSKVYKDDVSVFQRQWDKN